MGEWKTCTISELGEVVGGATPSTKKAENYVDGTYSWITPKDLSNFAGRYIRHGERNITEQGLKSCSTRLMPEKTILFSSRAPIGYIAIAEIELCTNQGFKSVIPNEETDYMFLYYLLKHNKEKIENMGSGTTFKEISGNTMKSILVSVPVDKKEQEKIASVLSLIDDKIELNNKINENLEQQAQTIFKAWFVDFEPFDGTMPDTWQLRTLGNVTKMSAGGDKPKNTSDVKTDKYSIPIFSNGITDEGLYGYTDTAKIFEECVTVSARGTIGFVCIRQEPFVPIVRLVTLIPNEEYISSKYLYFAIKQMNIMGTGTTQQQLTVPAFKTSEIVIPSKEIMQRYTKTVTPMFNQISANKAEITALTYIRDTLLPKLMSGELDVSDIEL